MQSFDKMKIKKKLGQDKYSGDLGGYVDHGSVAAWVFVRRGGQVKNAAPIVKRVTGETGCFGVLA